MTDPRSLSEISAGLDAWWLEQVGMAALALKSKRDLFRIHDGGRRMLGEKTPRPALDLKIVLGKDQSCKSRS